MWLKRNLLVTLRRRNMGKPVSGYVTAKRFATNQERNKPGKSKAKRMPYHKTGNRSASGYVEAEKFVDHRKRSRPHEPMSNQMSQHWVQHQNHRNMNKQFQRWRCYYCGRF